MDQINKYTLRFVSPEIEIQYQSQSIQNHLRPLYYAMLIMALILNLLQIIMVYVQNQVQLPLINIGFATLCFINIYVIYRNGQWASKTMTLLNFYVLLLQLNFDPNNTYGQEYFLYGSSLALIQAITYFATDFYLSCPSILIHLIFRQTITILLTHRFDLVSFGLTVSSGIFMSIVLYICNKAQRLQFLLSLKEDTFTNQLTTFINKPFAKIKYNEKKLELNVQMVHKENSFLGYQKTLCYGCNIRQFIRNCKLKHQPFEKIIINFMKIEQCFEVSYLKLKLILRVIKYNIDNSVLVILEECSDDNQNQFIIPEQVQMILQQQFSAYKKTFYFQQFKFGVMSILLLRQFQVKSVNLEKLITKMMKIYKFKNQNILKQNQGQFIKFNTYYQLLKVFFIQIFNILKELELQQNYIQCFQLDIVNQNVVFQIIIDDKYSFLPLYYKNFFIEQIQAYLLSSPLKYQLQFHFNRNLCYNEVNIKP